jgi:AcrR family transcriptional regulator
LTPPLPPSTSTDVGTDHRQRLLEGLATVLNERAYADLTIADIVASAHVSRRTFYEQFDGKDACLLALCEHRSQEVLNLIMSGYQHGDDWVAQLDHVTRLYLGSLQAQPGLLRALYLDTLSIGPAGLAMRRQISERFAQFLMMQVEVARLTEPHKRPLSPALATAVVGGINELILQAIEDQRADRLTELSDTISEFVQAVLNALLPAADGP